MGIKQRAQITMSDDEIAAFLRHSRTATLATRGPDGQTHLVAMWFGLVDGQVYFETKSKSQKAVNIRRDDSISVLVEDGLTYDVLRGVAISGRAEIVDDADLSFRAGVSVWERYNGEYTDELRPLVEQMLHNRIVVRLVPERTRSWDHRKLGLPAMTPEGSTAADLL